MNTFKFYGWRAISAEDDVSKAQKEFQRKHNASKMYSKL